MQADESATEQILIDRDRLKFVTENFHSLKTLWLAGLGVWMSTGEFVASPLGKNWPTLTHILNWVGFAAVIFYVWFLRNDNYYERRFGKVEEKPLTPGQAWGCLFIFVLALTCTVIQMIWGDHLFRVADSFISVVADQIHLLIADPTHEINLAGLLYAILVFGSRVWTHSITRGFNLDKALLLVCGTLTSICVFVSPFWYPEVKRWTLWQILNTCAFGLTIIVVGLHNHLTLIRLMPKKPREDGND